MAETSLTLGAAIPLCVQDTERVTDKVINVTLYNKVTFALIAGPVTLVHQANGFYLNSTLTMPNVATVLAQYEIFDSDGTTPNTTGDDVVTDIFQLIVESVSLPEQFVDIVTVTPGVNDDIVIVDQELEVSIEIEAEQDICVVTDQDETITIIVEPEPEVSILVGGD